MEKIKKIPFVVVLGLFALTLLYVLSFYSHETIKPTDQQTEKTQVAETKIEKQNSTENVDAAFDEQSKEFQQTLAVLFQKLPRKGFANESDTHQIPSEIMEAAVQIGQVADAYTQKVNLRPAAFDFYLQCTKDNDVIPQIRAVCYERAKILSVEIQQKKLTLDVPKEVLDLVGQ